MPNLGDRERVPRDQERLDPHLADRLLVPGGGQERLDGVLDPAAAFDGAHRIQFRLRQAHAKRTARHQPKRHTVCRHAGRPAKISSVHIAQALQPAITRAAGAVA
jgi:hypothetical protein